MSNGARAGVVAAAVAIVVIAFVALKPGSSSDKQDDTAADRAAQTTTTEGAKARPKASTPMASAPPLEVTLKGGAPVGGVKKLEVQKGRDVSLRVNTDEPGEDQIHLHGYDIEKPTSAGSPAVFKFKANIEGVFELESHTAEDAGREPLIAQLVVEPD